MDYSQVISEEHRGLIIIAINQSGSMLAPFQNGSMITTKSEIASMVACSLIEELVTRSRQEHRLSDPCPYCDIAVIGYSRNSVYSLIHDSTYILPITALNPNQHPIVKRGIEYITEDNHLHIAIESYREWIKPQAAGITPMTEMLYIVTKLVSEWCHNRGNKDSFPPIVFNITDSLNRYEYTSEHTRLSNILKQTGTKYGNTLLFNTCIDSMPKSERLEFPNLDDIPPSDSIELLAKMSSELPSIFYPQIYKSSKSKRAPHMGVCYNATILKIIPELKINVRWDNWKYNL